MSERYYCKNKRRRQDVLFPKDGDGNPVAPVLNGIDYLEVTSEDQKTLAVNFMHQLPEEPDQVPPTPATELTGHNIMIEGGVRIRNIRVTSVSTTGNVLTVNVDTAGDFSKYTLKIVSSPLDQSPIPGFDPELSRIDFSFKVNCPSDFDCKVERDCPPEKHDEPEIDYLAKDYDSFRRLMLDRVSLIMPEWKERSPADKGIMLIELLAHSGDLLSYYQDAVATEAYLGTAKKRASLRRHARLLDYRVSEGCNARTWIAIQVDEVSGADGYTLPAGTPVYTDEENVNTEPVVFETIGDITLRYAHNAIKFYTWSDSECCIPTGSTHATLRDDPKLSLEPGDILLFEETINPVTGNDADADPVHRQAVRLTKTIPRTDPLTDTEVVDIFWHEDDRLRFPLCVSAVITDNNGLPVMTHTAVARGNVVLADHGKTVESDELVPSTVENPVRYNPRLFDADLSYKDPVNKASASAAFIRKPDEAVPSITLIGNNSSVWKPVSDLLSTGRFEQYFVVESDDDGAVWIRFGDGIFGKRPARGTNFSVRYRSGNGSKGNIGRDSLKNIDAEVEGISRVTNPLPAGGGIDPESMEDVRINAPEAFRIQERAVTEEDYAEVTERHPGVQKARAMFRWTGSWHTVFVTIDRKGGLPVTEDTEFRDEIIDHINRYRIAGYDINVNGPIFVPLDLEMSVCLADGYYKSDVLGALLAAFGNRDLSGGRRGFFHPDNFTFGQPVYLSRLYHTAMQIPGVASAEITKFQRWGKKPNEELENAMLETSQYEIVRLDNDPNFPENGKIEFIIEGGL